MGTNAHEDIGKHIVASAIIGEDWKIYVWARHTHCFRALAAAKVKQNDHNKQWFVTAEWEFLDRYDAMIRARETWQLIVGRGNGDMLFSEDLR